MILQMNNIVKTYGNVLANNNVSLYLNKGEILSIVGENGAGKSTIMKILYGLEKPDEGEIIVKGKKVSFHSSAAAMKLGIGMVQQHFMLFDSLTVAENIVYNREKSKFGFYDKLENEKAVQQLCQQYGLFVDPKAIVSDLPVGMQQRVEILKTLYQNSDIIIFDEPSAVLTPLEVEELLATIKKLAESGKSIILITHKLNEVMSVADRIVVMRAGEVVATLNKNDTNQQELSMMMIGRRIVELELPEVNVTDEVLKVSNLTVGNIYGKKSLDNVSLSVCKGEIVGIAGVSGNGQSDLIKCISGLNQNYQGTILINGKDVSNKSVNAIRKAGETHIPEDRYYWGSAKGATLSDNYLMGQHESDEYTKYGFLKKSKIDEKTREIIKQYQVKSSGENQTISELSGGNAQKLITAREIERDNDFTIACEPTRGIDIGAMEFVQRRLIEKRNKGCGILLVSSELTEILNLSDRIYVMFEGRITAQYKRGEIDAYNIGLMMLGGKSNEN